MTERVHGYAEGYYGRLFNWRERELILSVLERNGQNTYYYAPKEDPLHRLHWRKPYDQDWLADFHAFTAKAGAREVQVVAGVAPGLDFNFSDLPHGPDYQALVTKCRCLLAAGAHRISLLMDDIDEKFINRRGAFRQEGVAHASLANALADDLGVALWVTPRIYANELAETAPDYLADFLNSLSPDHTVLYCGSDVVARQASVQSMFEVVDECGQPLVLWDNLYANDYCPRRLFVGAWEGRNPEESIVLNPTGMLHTDSLLMDLMGSATLALQTTGTVRSAWEATLTSHGVPDAFLALAEYFYHPIFNEYTPTAPTPANAITFDAIESCLWQWKSPLAREWYPYLFGLKHDLLISQHALPDLRVLKTQSHPLSQRLLK